MRKFVSGASEKRTDTSVIPTAIAANSTCTSDSPSQSRQSFASSSATVSTTPPSTRDNLVYDLVIARHGDPPPPQFAGYSEFPIFGPKAMSSSARRKRIGGIDPNAQAIIEGLQPHNRGNAFASDPSGSSTNFPTWTNIECRTLCKRLLVPSPLSPMHPTRPAPSTSISGHTKTAQRLQPILLVPPLSLRASTRRCTWTPS
jgi:hypothetical protein